MIEIKYYNFLIKKKKCINFNKKKIKKISKAHKAAYMLCELPFINNRETIVHGYPINRLDIDDSFILCCKSITDDIGIELIKFQK
jgi:hypothetical protein